jgi:hypothetical protein
MAKTIHQACKWNSNSLRYMEHFIERFEPTFNFHALRKAIFGPRLPTAVGRISNVIPSLNLTIAVSLSAVTIEQDLDRCNGFCDDAAVVCLQEVSEEWKPKLDIFFNQRGYTSSDALYGKRESVRQVS